MTAGSATQRATIEEWLAIPEERRTEIIDGEIIHQGMPGPRHGRHRDSGRGSAGESRRKRLAGGARV